MIRTGLSIAFFACSVQAFCAVEINEVEADTVRRYHLDEVVVTATRTPLSVKETPVLTRVIPASEIERSGLKNLQQVLETELAGVEFHQTGYGESMSFQGLDARYLLFLVDGERIAGETYGNIDYGRIPLNNIERIEIVRGASSVLYGSSAMGAVVNIITKTPDRPVRIVASGRYGGLYQSNGETAGNPDAASKLDIPNIQADLYAGFDFGRLKSQTTLSYTGTDPYLLRSRRAEERHYPDSLMIVEHGIVPPGRPGLIGQQTLYDANWEAPLDTLGMSVSGGRNVALSQRLDYRFSSVWRAFLTGGYFHKNRFDFPSSINTGSAAGLYTWEVYHSYNLNGGVEYRPNDRHALTLTYNGDFYKRSTDSLETVVPKQDHRYQTARLLWIAAFGDYNRLTAGAEYLYERLNHDLSLYGYDDRRTLETASLYVQDEIGTNTPFSFTAGVRIDRNDRFGWSVTPKASAKYAAGDISLRFNYARGYRNPSIKEMYMKFLIPMGERQNDTYIVGNSDLKPEHNQYFSLSAEYLSGFTHLSVSGYLSTFRDKIDVRRQAVDALTTHLVYGNIDRSRFSGVEVMARTRLLPWLFATANYNYVHDKEDAPEASTQYIYVSPHAATLQLESRFTAFERDFSLALSGKYTGRKEYGDMMPVILYDNPALPAGMPSAIYSGAYTAVHEGHTLWNLTASAQLTQNLKLQAGMNNLFDYRAPVVNFNSCMSAGRNGFVRLIFTFE